MINIDANSVGFLTLAGLALFLICLFLPDNSDDTALLGVVRRQYNDTYPLTPPAIIGKDQKFKIVVIADPDKASRNEDQVNPRIRHSNSKAIVQISKILYSFFSVLVRQNGLLGRVYFKLIYLLFENL